MMYRVIAIATTLLLCATQAAWCQNYRSSREAMQALSTQQARPYHLDTCDGYYYGTGYHGCGTATGGPVGGLPSRN